MQTRIYEKHGKLNVIRVHWVHLKTSVALFESISIRKVSGFFFVLFVRKNRLFTHTTRFVMNHNMYMLDVSALASKCDYVSNIPFFFRVRENRLVGCGQRKNASRSILSSSFWPK